MKYYLKPLGTQGRNGWATGAQFPDRRITMGRKKAQQCHKYFLHHSTFSSERPQVRTGRRQTFFLLRAPPNLVTPMMVLAKISHFRIIQAHHARGSLSPFHIIPVIYTLR